MSTATKLGNETKDEPEGKRIKLDEETLAKIRNDPPKEVISKPSARESYPWQGCPHCKGKKTASRSTRARRVDGQLAVVRYRRCKDCEVDYKHIDFVPE